MNERSSRRRRGDKWYAVGTPQVNVQQGGALYVHAVGGSKHQLREPATAAQAAVMMSESKRVNKQYSQSLSREYLTDPTLLMQLYLVLVSLLVKWGQSPRGARGTSGFKSLRELYKFLAACCLVLRSIRLSQIDWRGWFIDKHKYKLPDDEQNMHQKQATATIHAHMHDPSYVDVVPSTSSQDQ